MLMAITNVPTLKFANVFCEKWRSERAQNEKKIINFKYLFNLVAANTHTFSLNRISYKEISHELFLLFSLLIKLMYLLRMHYIITLFRNISIQFRQFVVAPAPSQTAIRTLPSNKFCSSSLHSVTLFTTQLIHLLGVMGWAGPVPVFIIIKY